VDLDCPKGAGETMYPFELFFHGTCLGHVFGSEELIPAGSGCLGDIGESAESAKGKHGG